MTFIAAPEPKAPVTQGWLRVSQRKLDPRRSTDYLPYYPHELVDYYRSHQRHTRDAWRTAVTDPADTDRGVGSAGDGGRGGCSARDASRGANGAGVSAQTGRAVAARAAVGAGNVAATAATAATDCTRCARSGATPGASPRSREVVAARAAQGGALPTLADSSAVRAATRARTGRHRTGPGRPAAGWPGRSCSRTRGTFSPRHRDGTK